MAKYLIIDKDVFEGIKTDDLCDFAKNHFLILPEVLYYECLTTEKDKTKLLDRFRSVILAGGYTGPRSHAIMKREADSLSPYGFLVDLETTPGLREAFQGNSELCSSEDIEEAQKNQLYLAETLIRWVDRISENTGSEEPEFIAAMRKFDTRKAESPERFARWAASFDSSDIRESAKRLLGEITNRFDRYCLSDEWVSWHFVRLLLILAQELWLSRETGSAIKKERVEHDLQDMEYVLLLSRADGLLTRDVKLCIPLAKAAFPEKEVFSCLEDVPDEYLCHWS